jgi:hypothetical protein
MMFLSVGKQDHESQRHHDKSSDDTLNHGSHSLVVGDRAPKDDTMGAAVNAQRWRTGLAEIAMRRALNDGKPDQPEPRRKARGCLAGTKGGVRGF